MEEFKMNMYDEMLNKYAQFLGYEGKVKADEKYMIRERNKIEKLIQFNDELEALGKHNESVQGRTIFACYKTNVAHTTEGEPACKKTDIDIIMMRNNYALKNPCICFEIDVRGNTYREISVDEMADILNLR